jgi:hypothetical protein
MDRGRLTCAAMLEDDAGRRYINGKRLVVRVCSPHMVGRNGKEQPNGVEVVQENPDPARLVAKHVSFRPKPDDWSQRLEEDPESSWHSDNRLDTWNRCFLLDSGQMADNRAPSTDAWASSVSDMRRRHHLKLALLL